MRKLVVVSTFIAMGCSGSGGRAVRVNTSPHDYGSSFGTANDEELPELVDDIDVPMPTDVESEAIPTAPPASALRSPAPCTPTLVSHSAPGARQADGDFARYIDCNRLVEPDEHPSANIGAGNGVLFTSEMFAFYTEHGWATDADRDAFVAIVRSLQAKPGLINRNPPNGLHDDQEGADDYVGLVAAAHMLGGRAESVANEVWDYGNKQSWIYNNVGRGFDIHAVIDRPWWVAHFSYCAGERPDVASETGWGLKMALGAGKGNPGEVALEWMMIHCLPNFASATAKAGAALWIHHFKKNWPGGMRDVMASYFSAHPGHPLITYAPQMDNFDRFNGLLGLLKGVIDMFLNEGVALFNSTVRDVRKLEGLASATVMDAIHLSTRTAQRFATFGERTASEADHVDKKLAAVEQRVGPEAFRDLVRPAEHPVEIVIKDAPKIGGDIEHPFQVLVQDAPKIITHPTTVIVKDVRNWVHEKKCVKIRGKKHCT